MIVSHRNVEDTVRCVSSLVGSEAPIKIVIADNNPHELSLQNALTDFDGLEILHPSENLGFAHGCNLGIEWARSHTDCEFVLLLHNDTIVWPDAVLSLEAFMDEQPDVGLMTGRIVFMEDPARLYCGRGRIAWGRGGSKVLRFAGSAMTERALCGGRVNFAPECAMFLRRSVIEEIGGLDETFFIYEEGVDLSLRVVKAGYRIFYCPEALILHHGHGIQGKSGWSFPDRWSALAPGYEFRIYHLVKNSVINVRKHARGRALAFFFFLYPMFVLWKTMAASRSLGLRAFGPAWRGLRAGLKESIERPRL